MESILLKDMTLSLRNLCQLQNAHTFYVARMQEKRFTS
jgi:hypothetical protein